MSLRGASATRQSQGLRLLRGVYPERSRRAHKDDTNITTNGIYVASIVGEGNAVKDYVDELMLFQAIASRRLLVGMNVDLPGIMLCPNIFELRHLVLLC